MLKGETQENITRYMTLIAAVDPGLYRIKIALEETQVNSELMPAVIRAISNIAYGTGYGQVTVYIQKGVASTIRTEEKDEITLPALLNEADK